MYFLICLKINRKIINNLKINKLKVIIFDFFYNFVYKYNMKYGYFGFN